MKKIIVVVVLLFAANAYAADYGIIDAAKNFDYNGMRSALLRGAGIDGQDENGRTALIIICNFDPGRNSYYEIYSMLKLLLKRYPYPDIYYPSQRTRREELTKALRTIADNPGSAKLSAEELSGLYKLLIRHGADKSALLAGDAAGGKQEEIDKKMIAVESERHDGEGFDEGRGIVNRNIDMSYIGFLPLEFETWKNDKCYIYFEGDLNPQMYFMSKKHSGTWNYFVNFVPKITLRMYQEFSSPVKTLSFMPRVTLYSWWGSLNNLLQKNSPVDYFYASLMVSHHSNGQSGNFYTSDGRVNTESGNFSTNFAELAFNAYIKSAWVTLAYRQHAHSINREPELKDQYELGRVFLSSKAFLCNDVWRVFGSVSYAVYGRKYIQSPEQANSGHVAVKGVKANAWDNFNWQLQVHFMLSRFWQDFEDAALFAKYDQGYDYYNIHFQEKIKQLQFGISFVTD